MHKEELLIQVAAGLVNLPYRWGGNHPSTGFDCSGLVIEILKSIGIIMKEKDYTADGLSRLFDETETVGVGSLLFYDFDKDGTIDHVEMVIAIDDTGEIYTIGARGGNAEVVDLESSISAQAYVKVRPAIPAPTLTTDPLKK